MQEEPRLHAEFLPPVLSFLRPGVQGGCCCGCLGLRMSRFSTVTEDKSASLPLTHWMVVHSCTLASDLKESCVVLSTRAHGQLGVCMHASSAEGFNSQGNQATSWSSEGS